MKKIYNEFLNKNEKRLDALKKEYLVDKELVEKEYTKELDNEHLFYDEDKKMYYGYKPLDLNDKELQKIRDLERDIVIFKKKSLMISVFYTLACFIVSLGIILAIVFAKTEGFTSFLKSIYDFGVVSLIFLGIAKILEGIDDLRRK